MKDGQVLCAWAQWTPVRTPLVNINVLVWPLLSTNDRLVVIPVPEQMMDGSPRYTVLLESVALVAVMVKL